MNYLKNCDYFTILFVIIALLLSPCYLIEYEEIYTYKMNNSESFQFFIDRFPDGTVLMVDVFASRLNISLLHPNRTMKFININQPCSTNECDFDHIMPFNQSNILIAYGSFQRGDRIKRYIQYNVKIFDWLGNIVSHEILFNKSGSHLYFGTYQFIKNTFYKDKYFFIIFKNNYFSYIEYKAM